MSNKINFVPKEKGRRIDNIPDSGVQTGNFFTDYAGCWWEYIKDKDNKVAWIIGNYPNSDDIDLPFNN